MSVADGFVCLIYVVFVGNVYGALNAGCPGGDGECDSGNNEKCSTDASPVCICNDGYEAGPNQTAVCFQAKNLGDACAADDECLLGDGQTGSKCSATPDCVCDTTNNYATSAGGAAPCVKDCRNPSASTGYVPETTPSSTIRDATATVTCANGYEGTAASITCQASGAWTAFSGCTIKDCGEPSAPTGYSIAGSGTTYQSTRTVTCDTGNGYTGTPPTITCEASGSWTAFSGCTTGGGTVDCGNPPSKAGYVPETSPASTLQGATVSVTCAVNYKGTAAQITCEASGSWSDYSGCSSAGTRIKLDFSLITVFAVLMLVLI